MPETSPSLLTASRELDALVAKKIFGCRVLRDVPLADQSWMTVCGCLEANWPHARGGSVMGELAGYSTDIAAAWEIVGMLAKPDEFHMQTISGAGSGLRWWVSFMGRTRGSFADSIEVAICRAALETQGVV